MTYAAVMVGVWLVAVVGTFVGLAWALRTLVRAEAASRGLRAAQQGLGPVAPATAGVEEDTTAAAHARVRLHTRISA